MSRLKEILKKLDAKKHSATIWVSILLIAVATLFSQLKFGESDELSQGEAEPSQVVEEATQEEAPAIEEEVEEAE
jgi:hypothetical protein